MEMKVTELDFSEAFKEIPKRSLAGLTNTSKLKSQPIFLKAKCNEIVIQLIHVTNDLKIKKKVNSNKRLKRQLKQLR